MRRSCTLILIVSSLSSAAVAQTARCRTNAANCQGYTTFGPAAVARCISIRGANRTDFCQAVGETRRILVNAGDRYCAVLGSNPVPEQCTAHWITVTEPQ